MSYQYIQKSFTFGRVNETVRDDAVRGLISEFETSIAGFKQRKEKAGRLASILDNLSFYHAKAAKYLSENISDREAFCSEYDARNRVRSIENEDRSNLQAQNEDESASRGALLSASSIEIHESPSYKLTLKEKRFLASLVSDFVESVE